MSIAQLLWYCAYCGNGPYVQEISDFCLICNSRQDGYSQDIRVSLPEPPIWDAHFQPLSHPQSPQEGTDGETVNLPSSLRRDSGFERGNLETESLESPTNTSRRARAPNDSLSIQEESLGLLEKCIFNLPDLASRPWMPRSRTVYPGQSCFSLETGKPSVAPKRRPDSPTRKAEVAFVRGQGACGACRKNKKAVGYRLPTSLVCGDSLLSSVGTFGTFVERPMLQRKGPRVYLRSGRRLPQTTTIPTSEAL